MHRIERLTAGRRRGLGLQLVCVLAVSLCLAGRANGQSLALDATLVSSGGGTTEDGAFAAVIAVGEPVVGRAAGGTLSVELGLFAGGAMVNVSSGGEASVLRFALDANYPNPFSRSTAIAYELPEATTVRLDVFDVLGRRVKTLVDGEQSAGRHTASFAAEELASGVYLYRLTAGAYTATRQMHLIR